MELSVTIFEFVGGYVNVGDAVRVVYFSQSEILSPKIPRTLSRMRAVFNRKVCFIDRYISLFLFSTFNEITSISIYSLQKRTSETPWEQCCIFLTHPLQFAT